MCHVFYSFQSRPVNSVKVVIFVDIFRKFGYWQTFFYQFIAFCGFLLIFAALLVLFMLQY